MRKLVFVGLLVVIVSALAFGGCAPQPPPGGEIVISALAGDAIGDEGWVRSQVWIDRINKEMAGWVRIDLRGGLDAMPREAQIEAVNKGIIGMTLSTASAGAVFAPEAMIATATQLNPKQLRESGIYDMINEQVMKKGNMVYVASLSYNYDSYVWWKKPVNNPRTDFKGMKIRAAATQAPGVRALGAEPVNIPTTELFTAAQQGVIDGCALPIYGAEGDANVSAWAKYGKFVGFYVAGKEVYVNLDVWNKIPPEAQKKFADITKDEEIKAGEYWGKGIERLQNYFKSKGVTFPKWSDADEKWWNDTWIDALWLDLAKRVKDLDRYKAAVDKYKK